MMDEQKPKPIHVPALPNISEFTTNSYRWNIPAGWVPVTGNSGTNSFTVTVPTEEEDGEAENEEQE